MAYKTYQYPKFQKGINLAMFVLFFAAAIVVWVASTANLIHSNDISLNEITGTLASIVVGVGLITIAFIVNMLTPDIHVQNDRFQLVTVFYCSDWVPWGNIRFIKEHILSSKRYIIHGVGIENIHPIYSLIGFIYHMGETSFLLTERIQGYSELIQILEANRPDLFTR